MYATGTNNKKPETDGKVVFCKRPVHVLNENLPTKRFYPYLNIVLSKIYDVLKFVIR